MNFDDERRIYHAKRNAVGALTRLGHRYSNAIGHLEQRHQLDRVESLNLADIRKLEFAALIGEEVA